jgi:hypothetical protein
MLNSINACSDEHFTVNEQYQFRQIKKIIEDKKIELAMKEFDSWPQWKRDIYYTNYAPPRIKEAFDKMKKDNAPTK